MTALKIAVIEDEIIIARNIMSILKKIGYAWCGPAITYTEAVELIEQEKPDLLLIDINLRGTMDGIDLAKLVNEKYHLPFIFLTANSDAGTIERVKNVRPLAFIVKPFTREDLFTAIEIAFSNFNTLPTIPVQPGLLPAKDFLFVKDGYRYQKLRFDEIRYLQSEHNYVNIFMEAGRKLLIRKSLNECLLDLPASRFKQCHRSYVVNLHFIDAVENSEVQIEKIKLPLSAGYRQSLLEILGIA